MGKVGRRLGEQTKYDLEGKQFGHLIALWPVYHKRGLTYWACQCACGKTIYPRRQQLLEGWSTSCGCSTKRDFVSKAKRKVTPEWTAYYAARKRCLNPNHDNYKHYGARGIEFRFKSFADFLAEIGRRPSPAHTVDRIDTNGHYEPGNVRWATYTAQMANKRARGPASSN
jgi:hypothetical protein